MESFSNITDAAECQNHCQNNVECYYWTVSLNGCYLKNQNASPSVKPNFTSGPKKCGKYSICFREFELGQNIKCLQRPISDNQLKITLPMLCVYGIFLKSF